MTVYAIAVVDSGGEVFHFYHPSGTPDPEGTFKVGEKESRRIYLTEELSDINLWIRTHYWKSGAWKTRDDKDTAFHTWTDEAWVFNSDKFIKEVRNFRNSKIASSDWTQLSDCKLSDEKKAEWVTYRQALRDVPANNSSVTDIDSVSWPTEPS